MSEIPEEIWLGSKPASWGAYLMTANPNAKGIDDVSYTRTDIVNKLRARITELEKRCEEEGIKV